jgi:transcriptional regulator with XRE-family HTH domain
MRITNGQCTAARMILNLSREETAKRAGLALSTLSAFERGETNSTDATIEALVRVFHGLGVRFPPGGVVIARSLIPCPEPHRSTAAMHGWYMGLLGWKESDNPFEPKSSSAIEWSEACRAAHVSLEQEQYAPLDPEG